MNDNILQVSTALQNMVQEQCLDGMLHASELKSLMCCSPSMKRAIEHGMSHGSLVLDELGLLHSKESDYMLSTFATTFPSIKSLKIDGVSQLIFFGSVRGRARQSGNRGMIGRVWQWTSKRLFCTHLDHLPRMNTLTSFVAHRVTNETFVAIESNLSHHFGNDDIAFPSLHTLKVVVDNSRLHSTLNMLPRPSITPQDLSRHTPQLLCLDWPYTLAPSDLSDLKELATNYTRPSFWHLLAKEAHSLLHLTLDSVLNHAPLAVNSYPGRIQTIEMSDVTIVIDTFLPPQLVSLKCAELDATNDTYLCAKNLPRSLTLLQIANEEDRLLRKILVDLDNVPHSVWAEHHLPPTLHFRRQNVLLQRFQSLSPEMDRTLFSLATIYPNVMYFFSLLQAGCIAIPDTSLSPSLYASDESVFLAQIQSFINVQVCEFQVAHGIMNALHALNECRIGRVMPDVQDLQLVQLLSQCLASKQIFANKGQVYFLSYPNESIRALDSEAKLACLLRWRAIMPLVWPNICFKYSVFLKPNHVDAIFLEACKSLTNVTIQYSDEGNDGAFLTQLKQHKNLRSVTLSSTKVVSSPELTSALHAIMNHLPPNVSMLSIGLSSERDCNMALMLHIPPTVKRIEIHASDTHFHRGGPYSPTTPPTWWPSLVQHVPTSVNSIYIDTSVSLCEFMSVAFCQWSRRLTGSGKHLPIIKFEQLSYELDRKGFFTFWIPLLVTISSAICCIVILIDGIPVFSFLSVVLVMLFLAYMLFFLRH